MTAHRLRSLLANHQSLRFMVAGGINTLFSLGVNIVALLVGTPVWLAMLFGTVAGIAFNFLTLGGYAFRDMSVRRIPRFVSAYALIYAAGLMGFQVVHRVVSSAVVCQTLLTIPLALLSYVIMSRFVFRKRGDR